MDTNAVESIEQPAVNEENNQLEPNQELEPIAAKEPSIADDQEVNEDIKNIAVEVQNKQSQTQNQIDKQEDVDAITEFMETATEAPLNSGDGQNLSCEITKVNDNVPGRSNVKRRRRRHCFIMEKCRDALPRKSKTKAYEYLKNIAKGFFNAARLRGGMRMKTKRLAPTKIVRSKKSNSSRRSKTGRQVASRKSRMAVRDSGTSLSSDATQTSATTYNSKGSTRFFRC